MSSPQRHPRRRPVKDSSEPRPAHAMSLRKGNTFSSPKPDASDICSLENHRFMSRRSPTNTEDLEALVQGNTRVSRVSEFLKNFDNTINGSSSSSSASTYTNLLNDPEVLPVPQFMLESHTPMEIDSPSPRQPPSHDHASDSGLGSSVASKDNASIRKDASSTHNHYGGINGHAREETHTLSEFACEEIKKAIVNPILAEPSLKEFHPLLQDVPRRIGEKSIRNLRDLEKTLIFLAPEFSATSDSYFRFCNQTIRLLQATVDALPERDLRLPTDRPYTSNYFLDLVQQIRRYAEIMAITRRKEQEGDQLDTMDYSRDEKITLRGGLSHDGRPMELVREKNGQVIPLAEGVEKVQTGFSSSKRALSDDEMDVDEATRSMARRRKSEKPGDVRHRCNECRKEFKRPCDLTKHEKTHSRPWKCDIESCKYFELGWPTEKECERHKNDKHSAAPAQYKCLFEPCTYVSKRESNCKQHMEKAHGWEYVRSKSNGRKKAPVAGSDRAPPTPLTPFLGTPLSLAHSTPMTPFNPSPLLPELGFDYSYGLNTPAMPTAGYQDTFRRDSTTTDGSNFTYSSGQSPLEPTSFENAVTPEDPAINHNDVFSNCNYSNTNFDNAFQQPTPAMSTGFNFEQQYFPMPSGGQGNMQHLSPSGQANMTLYSPAMPADEGFGDGLDANFQPSGDFTLFQETASNDMALSNDTTNFFPEIDMGQFQNSDFYIPSESALNNLENFDFTRTQ